MVRILTRTPDTVRAILEDLPDDLLHADEGEGTFSPFSVLGHLIQGEKEDWLPRARIIVTDGRSRPFDPFDRFAHVTATEGRTLEELLDDFANLRKTNLEGLSQLLEQNPDPASVGTHPELGEVTLTELLATWVVHDLDHLAQIARVVARQFEDEVGPWREYLPILIPREPPSS
jgi:uncharacterized damage-inducible protein DinB